MSIIPRGVWALPIAGTPYVKKRKKKYQEKLVKDRFQSERNKLYRGRRRGNGQEQLSGELKRRTANPPGVTTKLAASGHRENVRATGGEVM